MVKKIAKNSIIQKYNTLLFFIVALTYSKCLPMDQHPFPSSGNPAKKQRTEQDQKQIQESIPALSAEEKILAEYTWAKSPADIDKVTHELASKPEFAPTLALWLKVKGKPNNWIAYDPIESQKVAGQIESKLKQELESEGKIGQELADELRKKLAQKLSRNRNIYGQSPLSRAIKAGNLPGVKVLLADPRTHINNQEDNDSDIMQATFNATDLNNSSPTDIELLRLLFFCDFNPTILQNKKIVVEAQEINDTFNDQERDYSNFFNDYHNKEKYYTPEEIEEFGLILAKRNAPLVKNIMNRKAGIRIPRKKITAQTKHSAELKQTAEPATFAWPSKEKKSDK